MKTLDLLFLAAVGVGGYYLYKKTSAAASAAANFVADPIAAGYLSMTLPGSVGVTGNMILPSGSVVPMSTLYVDENLQFVYLGRTYTVTGRNGNNYTSIAS